MDRSQTGYVDPRGRSHGSRSSRRAPANGVFLADDANPEVQVQAVEERGDGYVWEARWVPQSVPAGDYRLCLLARQGLAEEVGSGCTVQ